VLVGADPPAHLEAVHAGQHETAAVNDALAALQASAGCPSGGADLDALGGRLRDIQQQTTRQFSAFTDSLLDAQAALARRAGEPR
ncbi:hypothetical protein, partial [Asanoa sp. NPDC050611]|uniref:hypothetical protein n=1 Tax=Asanoa sp. NPDC050611 TaxID=3157098 RepID=UPI003401AB5D